MLLFFVLSCILWVITNPSDMKYTSEIIIEKPVEEVVSLFDNPDNLDKWMEGLQSIEHLSGTPGEPGSTCRLVFQMGKRRIEMIETVLERNLPRMMKVTYDAKNVHNIVVNRFSATSKGHTRYINEQEFHFRGMMRLFGFLMPGAFKKQSMKYLEDFKRFAEAQ